MVRIKLDNKDFEVSEGTSVLNAAREAGFTIPTLCYKDGLPHYTSCMVCMVRDNKTKGFFASCSVNVQEGMDLDLSSEEVIFIRRKSLELLLSEHRAECEAPCRIVCPAGYNIPLFNRYLSAKDYEKAVSLTLSEVISVILRAVNVPVTVKMPAAEKNRYPSFDPEYEIVHIQEFCHHRN
ncbi:MAG: (2Fe-2S)-binding protein [Bacteroidales bacterium]|nr:(2Fe-2S)-binding protein [Bacteroidales bacterium]